MKRLLVLLSLLCIAGALLTSPAGAMDENDLREIHKAIQEKGARWTAADNPIFRLSPEEQRQLCGLRLDAPDPLPGEAWAPKGPRKDLPEKLDWRDVDGVDWTTPIRNQASCGSCVAFGTMGSFEARINIFANSPGQDLDLSEQHIFSCGGGRCNYGWWQGEAAQYLQDYGAPLESCLPYQAVDDNCDQTCSDWLDQVRKISGWSTIRWLDGVSVVERMKTALLEGPLVGGYMVYDDFFSYSGGVYQYTWGDLAGGHCISIIGWDDADSCWICKNSWGPNWGDHGYFRIRMGTCEVGIEETSLALFPEPAYTAHVEVQGLRIDDHISNNDGIPDPGETFDFTVTINNMRTWGDLTDVSGWLLPTDPRVNIVDVQTNYPDLPGGASIDNIDDPFTISLDDKIGITSIPFNLYVNGTCMGIYPYSVDLRFELPVTLAQSGWPVLTSSGVRSSPLMVWNGGGPRRLASVEDSGYLHLWEADGQEVEGFPFRAPGGNIWSSVALGDLDGDGQEDLIFGSKNDTLYAVRQNGTLLFKRNLGADILTTPAVADMNADGSPEIVLGTSASELHVLTAQGQKYDPFPIVLGGSVVADAALADLDGDDQLDVIVGASDGKIYAISTQTGVALPGFPVSTGGPIWSAPAIADINGDQDPDIVIGSDDRKLYMVKSTGETMVTYRTSQAIKSSPAIADLDGNGRPDVIFTTQDGRIYAINQWGYCVSGWPYTTGKSLFSSPIVLDIDDDGGLEVVLEADGPNLIHLDRYGNLIMSLPLGMKGLPMSTPAAGDLDNDGDLEIAVGGPKGICVWNYPTASTVAQPWPMYRGNVRRTGYVGDVTTGATELSPAPSVPDQYALWQNYPNPFNPETSIRYSLGQAGSVRLSIYNVLGQEVVTLVNGHRTTGLHEVAWPGTDSAGHRVSSGLYFYRLEAGDFVQTKKMILLK